MNKNEMRLTNNGFAVEWIEIEKRIIDFSAIKIGFLVLRISRLLDNEDSPFIFLENYFHSQITLKVGEVFSQLLYDNYEIDCNDNLNFLNEKKTDS